MFSRSTFQWLLTLLAGAGLGAPALAQPKVDAKLPDYAPREKLSGMLSIHASDAGNQVETMWAEGFSRFHPDMRGEVGRGTSSAPVRLIRGSVQFGAMGRAMKTSDVSAFQKEFGYEPTALPSCIDMVSVFVHKDNPIKGLTLQQVDAVFSKTRKGGHNSPINTWGDLDLGAEWKDKPIVMHSRVAASATYGFFKERALFNGDFRDEVKEQPGSSSVVQAVGKDKFAIGYAGFAHKTAGVRAVPVAVDAKASFVPPEPQHARSGKYPLARPILVYVNHKPGTPLDPLRAEFIRYIYSKQGQTDALKVGFVPVDAEMAAKALGKVGLK
jgi:phosphate transport system substrate-binding protein